jgi:dimethylhistidine N-methyltransferase
VNERAAGRLPGFSSEGFVVTDDKDDAGESGYSVKLLDYEPTADDFLDEALAGLRKKQKTLPCKFFYDKRGSALFDRICELDEYYLTRTEIAIMNEYAGEMAEAIGPDSLIVEYGSGSATKTRILLEHLQSPAGCVLVDISREHLLRVATDMAGDFPEIEILPVCANFTEPFGLPETVRPAARAVGYFPGSTIGNFAPEEAKPLLRNIAKVCREGGGLLIGADLKKDVKLLEAAYDDSEGVTAAFNLNLLVRMNRELGADFDVDRFRFRSFYNEGEGRVESYLVSQAEQTVRVGGEEFRFEKDETIHTENSHKYTLGDFAEIAEECGFSVERVWTDEKDMFSVQYLRVV